MNLYSPHNGHALKPVGEHLLSDGELLWPVLDNIAYLRPKHAVRTQAVELIQTGQIQAALVCLLQDQDPFAPIAAPDDEAVYSVIQDNLSLRQAMQQLNYGPVADYFAHRRATPTYLSGLALLQHVVHHERTVIEFACGIGHFLATLEAHGFDTLGTDLVFSKLWLARHYLNVQGLLVCSDINFPVIHTEQPATVFCHDALYFFENKTQVLEHLRTLANGGSLAVGHVHTNSVDHNVAGYPLAVQDYAELADSHLFFDDMALTRNWFEPQNPSTMQPDSEAVAWIEGETNTAPYLLHKPASRLQLNPMIDLDNNCIHWPTPRFQQEYADDAAYLNWSDKERLALQHDTPLTDQQTHDLFQRRVLVDLPAAW